MANVGDFEDEVVVEVPVEDPDEIPQELPQEEEEPVND